MSNVLILCSGYFGKANANGLCAQCLIEEMQNNEHCVSVISVGDDEVICSSLDGVSETAVSYKKINRRSPKNIIAKAWRVGQLFLHAWSPKYNKDVVKKMTALAKKQCEKNKIDVIVSVYFPFESVLVGKKLKKQFPGVKYIIYELDSVGDGIVSGAKWHKPISHAYKCAMGRAYKKSDRVIIMKSHEAHWTKEHVKYVNKMKISDLPVLVAPELSAVQCNKEHDQIRFIYSGALDNSYRSPQSMLTAFGMLGKEPYSIEFYIKGCENELEEASKADNRILIHGYVDKKDLDSTIAGADILISVGNRVSNCVPSKVITYMTYGKPIIHFSLQKHDVCVEYLEKYPISMIIGCDELPVEAAERIRMFVNARKAEPVDFDKLCNDLPMNIPAYSVGLIMQLLEGAQN